MAANSAEESSNIDETQSDPLPIPCIYLNFSDRQESICLHTPQDGDKMVQFTLDDTTPTNETNYARRVSQRSWFSDPSDVVTDEKEEFLWLDTFDHARSLRKRLNEKRRSSSSSSGYTAHSASHVSTCGSKSRLGSFDQRSLPESSSDTNLMRTFSSQYSLNARNLSRRQAKSCSNLTVTTNLYCDELPDNVGNDSEINKTFEEMYDAAYGNVTANAESPMQKDERIQNWLRTLYLAPPSSQEEVVS